jgi:hypothetical protein
VIYANAARATNKDVADNALHMALELERIFDGNRAPGRIVWLIDFNGCGGALPNARQPHVPPIKPARLL